MDFKTQERIGKKLKELGFKFNHEDVYCMRWCHMDTSYGLLFHIPTLSELIAACGNNFISLEKPDGNRLTWMAQGVSNGIKYAIGGWSPEEAVANLWISLKEDEQGNSTKTV